MSDDPLKQLGEYLTATEAESLASLVRPDSGNLMLGHIVLFNSEFLALQDEVRRRGRIGVDLDGGGGPVPGPGGGRLGRRPGAVGTRRGWRRSGTAGPGCRTRAVSWSRRPCS